MILTLILSERGIGMKRWLLSIVVFMIVSKPLSIHAEQAENDNLTTVNDESPVVFYDIRVDTANPSGGMVSGGGRVIEGGSTQIRAEAAEGYRFDKWMSEGRSISQQDEYKVINVKTDILYTAVFVQEAVTGTEDSGDEDNGGAKSQVSRVEDSDTSNHADWEYQAQCCDDVPYTGDLSNSYIGYFAIIAFLASASAVKIRFSENKADEK